MNKTDEKLAAGDPTPQGPLPVKFIHEKCPQYRTYHVDGAWGAITGLSNIQLELYSEHPPLPKAVIHPVKPDGTYTGEQSIEGIDDPDHFVVVRDFQLGVVLSLQSAKLVHEILGNFIEMSKTNSVKGTEK